ncbi:S41 family peptidase [Niabella hirudinis]|uniref:S41 family peptidase n=1 Tax=Niabella hirudinis TaxID=1285929 RepID=UPI003EBEC085
MKKLILPALAFLWIIPTACHKKKDALPDDKKPDTNNLVVSQFVYDGLSLYYLWADDMKNKKPKTSDTNPEAYFKSVLNPIDTTHGWSWITDDVDALLADFSGTPKDLGWALALYRFPDNTVKGFVKYVYPGTPAAAGGITRGNIIDKIDGATMNTSNYLKLFSGNPITVNVSDQNYANAKTVNLTPLTIATNPVLKDSIYQNQPGYNGKKIGYLFYTAFIGNYNTSLYDAFNRFKAGGVTDLVIDLRYNHGGDINAAAYLASLIAPASVVQSQSVFTILNYNSFLNAVLDQQYGPDSRKDFFINSGTSNPLNANLNLSTVYIIATDDSYSAAELLTHCLKPYMNVVHIGSNTGGKYTASITIHAFDSKNNRVATVYNPTDLSTTEKSQLAKWAMQPIVAKYADKNGNDFSLPGYLVPNYPVTSIENQPSAWKPIGATNDYLLAKAISVITGTPVQAEADPLRLRRAATPWGNYIPLSSPREERMKGSVRLNASSNISAIPLQLMKRQQPALK